MFTLQEFESAVYRGVRRALADDREAARIERAKLKQCAANTKTGERCTRPADAGDYCSLHRYRYGGVGGVGK